MGAHSLLSASGSHRWLACTPSAFLERQFADETSAYAAEGIAAHALSEYKLRKFLKTRSKRPVSEYDSPEMEENTDAYVAYACELIAESRKRSIDAIILLEQKLDFSHFVPQGFELATWLSCQMAYCQFAISNMAKSLYPPTAIRK